MPLDIETSIQFVKDRAAKTKAAQKTIAAKWVWSKKTEAQWEHDADELDSARDGTERNTTPSLANLAIAAALHHTQSIGVLRDRLNTLHSLTVQAVNVMRSDAIDDVKKFPVVSKLTARGDSQADIEDEGASLLAAWKLCYGVDYIPAPENTYENLRALIEGTKNAQDVVIIPSARQLKANVKDAEALSSQATGGLNALISKLEDDCVRWYAQATAVFAEGTIEGDMIRGTVPTSDQYAPGPAKPAVTTPPATLAAMPAPGTPSTPTPTP